MPTTVLKPNTNWHRMLHLLDLNQGTLYRAQLYVPKMNVRFKATGDYYKNGSPKHKMVGGMTPDHNIRTDGMPKMTNVAANKPTSYAYEHRADRMGLVAVSRYNNRKYVTLLPKGKDVLDNFFRKGKKWEIQ